MSKKNNTPQKPKRTRPDNVERNSVKTAPGDNLKYITHNMEVNALADNKVDMTNYAAVEDRLQGYFLVCAKNDMKPSVAGMALAFGITRKTLYEWITGRVKYIPSDVVYLMQRYYQILNAQMEDYMQNNKINPVAGIFLMKNNMGYEDRKEITVAPGDNLGEEVAAEELRRKYIDAVQTESAERLLEAQKEEE